MKGTREVNGSAEWRLVNPRNCGAETAGPTLRRGSIARIPGPPARRSTVRERGAGAIEQLVPLEPQQQPFACEAAGFGHVQQDAGEAVNRQDDLALTADCGKQYPGAGTVSKQRKLRSARMRRRRLDMGPMRLLTNRSPRVRVILRAERRRLHEPPRAEQNPRALTVIPTPGGISATRPVTRATSRSVSPALHRYPVGPPGRGSTT